MPRDLNTTDKNTNNFREEIENLTHELLQLEKNYYSGNAQVDDEVFDFKLRKLLFLEKKFPNFALSNSPTKNVGFCDSDSVVKIKHETPMLSLDNAFNEEELLNFFKNTNKFSSEKDSVIEYFVEPKIDGASISLVYRDNYLKHAISRGDGIHGEDLTEKVKYMANVPLKICSGPKNFTLRGEVYITKSDFEEIQNNSAVKFNNHRNFVAGSLRLKNAVEIASKNLRLMIYSMVVDGDEKYTYMNKQSEVISWLKKWSVPTHTHNYTLLSSSKDEIINFINRFKDVKGSWEVPTDGLVIKVDQKILQEEIGFTSKFPKWAIAYKYPSLIKETKLLEIKATVGRSGKITYLGKLAPVEINGTTIQFATLHNADYILKLKIREGDIVQVYKSGEIIPQIICYVDSENRNMLPEFQPLHNCPCCNSPLSMKTQKLQKCENKDCFDRKIASLTYFVSRDCMNIEGLSVKLIQKFVNLNIIKKISDIYYLHEHKELIINAGIHLKDKAYKNLINSIEASKSASQEKILNSLGIDQVGKNTSKLLLKKFKSIRGIFSATREEIASVYGIGEVCVNEVLEWIKDEQNQQTLIELEKINIIKDESESLQVVESFLHNKSIVITGSFEMTRNQLSEILEHKFGAIVKKNVIKNLDFLLVGDNPGNKLNEAKKNGVEIITVNHLRSLKIL